MFSLSLSLYIYIYTHVAWEAGGSLDSFEVWFKAVWTSLRTWQENIRCFLFYAVRGIGCRLKSLEPTWIYPSFGKALHLKSVLPRAQTPTGRF